MARRIGISPAPAADQLQKAYPPATAETGLQPLPPGAAGRATPKQVGIEPGDPVTFYAVGDSGGVMDPNPQMAVAKAMIAQTNEQAPGFVYHLGDVDYFNGDITAYAPQFGEPYAHLVAPIVGIPGNHDGDPDPTVTNPSQTGIATFMATFCTATPTTPLWDTTDEYGRDTETQPYCDWSLVHPAVTIIGVWSNVPSGGHLYESQTSFLVSELEAAPTGVPLVVALHHPPYSVDAHHGGSQTMGSALDAAFASARRQPELVLSGHVHDYQRFTRTLAGREITYIVSGNGGYHNLHAISNDAATGQPIAGADPDVIYEAGDDQHWGFLIATASHGTLDIEYAQVQQDGQIQTGDQVHLVAAGAAG